jgi:hypothetical protein
MALRGTSKNKGPPGILPPKRLAAESATSVLAFMGSQFSLTWFLDSFGILEISSIISISEVVNDQKEGIRLLAEFSRVPLRVCPERRPVAVLALLPAWREALSMLWVDKYRPTSLDKLDFHADVSARLKKLVLLLLLLLLLFIFPPLPFTS